MDKYIDIVPVEFWLAKKEALERAMSVLPVVTRGVRRSKAIYRVFTGEKYKYREISQDKDPVTAQKLESIIYRRNALKEQIKTIKRLLSSYYSPNEYRDFEVINKENRYDTDFFDCLEDGSCSIDNDKEYVYNGRAFRSRIEMMIATLLDELGLEYKYDVKFKVDGQIVTVDFVIVLREFSRCIFFEYYGRCDDPIKNRKNGVKIEHMCNGGIYLGRDLFILSGDEVSTAGPSEIRKMIAFALSIVAGKHLRIGH